MVLRRIGFQYRRLFAVVAMVTFGTAIIGLTGCYERVVRSDRPAAMDDEIHEPAVTEDQTPLDELEDLMMPER